MRPVTMMMATTKAVSFRQVELEHGVGLNSILKFKQPFNLSAFEN